MDSNFLIDFKEISQCSICTDTVAYAHNLVPCADTFCYSCIMNWVKKEKKKTCPNCRASIHRDLFVHNKIVDQMIHAAFERLNPAELPALEDRISEEKEAKRTRETEASRRLTRPKRTRELDSLLRTSPFHPGALIATHSMTTRSRNRFGTSRPIRS